MQRLPHFTGQVGVCGVLVMPYADALLAISFVSTYVIGGVEYRCVDRILVDVLRAADLWNDSVRGQILASHGTHVLSCLSPNAANIDNFRVGATNLRHSH